MIKLQDIHSLTDFQRNTRQHIERMKKTGRGTILTVNGQPELLVFDSKTGQELLDKLDQLEIDQAIRRGIEDMNAGRGMTLGDFDAHMRKKYNMPSRKT